MSPTTVRFIHIGNTYTHPSLPVCLSVCVGDMDKYEILSQLGDGTFGCVMKALHKKTGQVVAIKKMKQKYYSWEECVKLPEVVVVRRIHGHPNIVKMREVIRENSELFFVFEYMDGDLLGVIRKAKQMQKYVAGATGPSLGYPKIKSYIFQILQSLAYLHRQGYFHRDLKPENLLIRKDPSSPMQEVVKLADFGLVKEIRAKLPFTDYVSTRWYRAPELLLQDRAYNSPVDIWAVGCIIAELITTRPLFAGSNEVDQLHKIMSVLGSPNEQIWPEGVMLAKKIRYSFPVVKGVGLERMFPAHLPPQVLDLMKRMLSYDPRKRPTAQECLQHPYFDVGLAEENFARGGVEKQLASAAKKYSLGPQTAPSGNVVLPDVVSAKRPLVGSTTADLKPSGVEPVPPLQQPQDFCVSSGAPKAHTLLREKKRQSPSASKTLPDIGGETVAKKKSFLPKISASPVTDVKNGLPGDSGDGDGDGGDSGGNGGDEGAVVDLDGLVKEFACELKTLGLFPQQKQHSSCPAVGKLKKHGSPLNVNCGKQPLALPVPIPSPEEEKDPVKAFLNSTRYRSTLSVSGESDVPLNPLKKLPLLKRDSVTTLSPSISSGNHAVSPSIKVILAKHMGSAGNSSS